MENGVCGGHGCYGDEEGRLMGIYIAEVIYPIQS